MADYIITVNIQRLDTNEDIRISKRILSATLPSDRFISDIKVVETAIDQINENLGGHSA